jgi:hypothetical protein
MLFNMNRHTMLPNALFAVFAALAAPGFAPSGDLTDQPLAAEPGDLDWDSVEIFSEAEQDQKEFDLANPDAVDERQQNNNPHNPDPQSPACKKKENEPPGCPGKPR